MWRREELGGAAGPFYALAFGIATISQAPCVRRFFFSFTPDELRRENANLQFLGL